MSEEAPETLATTDLMKDALTGEEEKGGETVEEKETADGEENGSAEGEKKKKKKDKKKKEKKHKDEDQKEEGEQQEQLATTDLMKDALTGEAQEAPQAEARDVEEEKPKKKKKKAKDGEHRDAEGQTAGEGDAETREEHHQHEEEAHEHHHHHDEEHEHHEEEQHHEEAQEHHHEEAREEEHHGEAEQEKAKSSSSESSSSSSSASDDEPPPLPLAEVDGKDEEYAPREPESAPPSSEPKQPKRPKPAPRAPPQSPQQQEPAPAQNYSDEELKKMVDKMLKTQKSPDIEAIPAMKQYVEGQMRDAALGQRYEYGAKMELADEMMDKFLIYDDSEIQREKKRKEAEDKLLETKGRLIEVNKEWDEKINKWRSDQSQRVNELEAEHNAQVEEFEKKWADPNYLTQFNKPSQQLLNLRQVEQTLAMSKLFERAQQTKVRADQLQKEEVAEAQKRAVTVMRNEFETLEAKQKREMECLLQYTKRNVDFMEQERARQVRPLEHIIERLTPLAYPKKRPDRTKQFYKEKEQEITPRPIRNVQSARTMKNAHGLSIPGINMRQYIKTKKGTARNTQTVKRAD